MFEDVEGFPMCRRRVFNVRTSFFPGHSGERRGNLGEVLPTTDAAGTKKGTYMCELEGEFEQRIRFRSLASDRQPTELDNVTKVIDP